jgi:tight adherence protein B
MINPIAIAACLALGFGGLAFAFLGGDSRADKRRAAVAKTDAKASVAAGVDRAARKKQIAVGVRDSEMKGKRRRVSLAAKIEQAGLSITKQQYWIGSVLLGLICGVLT